MHFNERIPCIPHPLMLTIVEIEKQGEIGRLYIKRSPPLLFAGTQVSRGRNCPLY